MESISTSQELPSDSKNSKNNKNKVSRISPRRFFRLRLSLIILIATFFSITVGQMALLAPSLFYQEDKLLAALITETTRLVKVANLRSPLEEQTEKDIIERLEKLSFFSAIIGGRLYDTLGDPVGGFGMEASLSRNSVAANEGDSLRSPDRRFLDIFVSQGKSGLSYDLILRLDASHIPSQVKAYLIRVLRSAATVSLITVFLLMLVMHVFLTLPVKRIHKSILAAVDNPDLAKKYLLKFSRRDEIGALGSAIDQFLLMLSITYQGDLSASHDVVEQSSSAVVQYDIGGELLAANPAALKLFQADSLSDLSERSQEFLTLPKLHKENRYTIPGSIESFQQDNRQDSYIEDGEVLVNGREIPCLVNAHPVRRSDGEIKRYIAIITDLSEVLWQSGGPSSNKSVLAMEKRELEKRNLEIKKLLESCLILLDAATARKTTEAEREPVITDRVIAQWYSDAQACGLTHSEPLKIDFLPVVMGNSRNQAYLFWQALTLIYMRSKYQTPQLTVLGERKPGGMSEFTILDISEKAGLNLKSKSENKATDWKLCFAALSQLISQEGGKLQGFADDKHDNAVVFSLIRASDNIEVSMLKNKAVAA